MNGEPKELRRGQEHRKAPVTAPLNQPLPVEMAHQVLHAVGGADDAQSQEGMGVDKGQATGKED